MKSRLGFIVKGIMRWKVKHICYVLAYSLGAHYYIVLKAWFSSIGVIMCTDYKQKGATAKFSSPLWYSVNSWRFAQQ